jgi:hypothetical protein
LSPLVTIKQDCAILVFLEEKKLVICYPENEADDYFKSGSGDVQKEAPKRVLTPGKIGKKVDDMKPTKTT